MAHIQGFIILKIFTFLRKEVALVITGLVAILKAKLFNKKLWI